MKTQMRFQKILMIVTLVIGALGAVFALAFCSGAFNQLCLLDGMDDVNGLQKFIDTVQSANDTLFIIGIVYVVICLLPLIAACQKRRNYYITNYIAIGIVVVFQLIFAILVIVMIANVMQAYNAVDLTKAASNYDLFNHSVQYGPFSTKPWTVAFGYVVIALSLVDMVLLVLNVVWKVLLMKGEKQLLNGSKPAEDKPEGTENSDVASEVV